MLYRAHRPILANTESIHGESSIEPQTSENCTLESKESELAMKWNDQSNYRVKPTDNQALVMGGAVGLAAAAIGSLAWSYCQDTRYGGTVAGESPSQTGAFQKRISEAISRSWA